jgi:hypothetical protein
MQAARCAGLTQQTHDQESAQRYQQLEQTYLQLAEAEERAAGQTRGVAGKSEPKSAA